MLETIQLLTFKGDYEGDSTKAFKEVKYQLELGSFEALDNAKPLRGENFGRDPHDDVMMVKLHRMQINHFAKINIPATFDPR